MAMIDYGAILRVEGEFINKNKDMFMDASDTGYVCKSAVYALGNGDEYDGTEVPIDGNYFVYAGDEDLLVVFYKGLYKVILHEKIVLEGWNNPFASETHYLDKIANITVSHLDKNMYCMPMESSGTWREFMKEIWSGATGDEKLSELDDGYKIYKRFVKRCKNVYRTNRNGGCYKYRTDRYIATWEHKGKKYEVIFGCGIDPNERVWNRIKNDSYGFTDVEREIIDGWFGG